MAPNAKRSGEALLLAMDIQLRTNSGRRGEVLPPLTKLAALKGRASTSSPFFLRAATNWRTDADGRTDGRTETDGRGRLRLNYLAAVGSAAAAASVPYVARLLLFPAAPAAAASIICTAANRNTFSKQAKIGISKILMELYISISSNFRPR